MAHVTNSILIENARLIDGTGAPEQRGAVAVVDGRITAVGPGVGPADAPESARRIDARGRVVAPGFIDVHTHFDPQLCWDRLATPALEHGVTTVLAGNCSLSLAPVRAEDRRPLACMFRQIEDIPLATFEVAVPWSWESYGEWLEFIRPGLGINVAGLVGHSPLRHFVMGAAAQERAATEDEIASMSRVLREAIRAGAAGLSTSYVDSDENMRPVASRYATRDEIIALGRAMAEEGRGLIQTVPLFFMPEAQLQNMRDMAEISRQTGLMCSVAPIVHSPYTTLAADSLKLLEEEAATGAKLFGQSMPRPFDINIRLAATSFVLYAMPAWAAIMRLPLAERLEAFGDTAQREALRNQSVLLGPAWNHLVLSRAATPAHRALEGRLLREIATERGVHPVDAWLDIACAEELQTEICLRGMIHSDPAGVAGILQHPLIHIGASDAGAHIAQFCGSGDTSWLLGHWVRELGVMSLERAVHRLTGELADAFGIRGRGRLEPGLAGDLVLFDAATIDRGDEEFVKDVPGGASRYLRHARGIDCVAVGGSVVWENGAYTEARSGTLV